MDQRELENVFERLGATDPEGLAGSATREGLPQLAAYLFLRAAWKRVLPDRDLAWVSEAGRPLPAGSPCAELAPAIDHVLSKAVDPLALTTIVRTMQFNLLSDLCYLLSDSGFGREDIEQSLRERLSEVGWALFETSPDGEPLQAIPCIHELVLSMDPTGREMRPDPEAKEFGAPKSP